jgi:hypothetical protein
MLRGKVATCLGRINSPLKRNSQRTEGRPANRIKNPAGDTTTYAIPAKSCDTGGGRRSVNNPGPAGSRAFRCSQDLDPSSEMAGRQMRVAKCQCHCDITVACQCRDFLERSSGLHQAQAQIQSTCVIAQSARLVRR